MDHFVGSILQSLFIHEHFLIKLFTGTQSCKFNLDVLIHLIAGQADQILRQIQDFHRFSHIQHKDFSAARVGSCLQHQRYRFRNGHKITDDIRMGYCHRASGQNLFPEQGNHRAVAAQHISKTHCHKLRVIMTIKGLDDHFADPLGGSHDVGGIYRLIRGDHNKGLHPAVGCGGGHLPGAEYVVFNGLIRALFHEGHMLMGCRMVDNVGFILVEDPVHTPGVAHRGNQHHQV